MPLLLTLWALCCFSDQVAALGSSAGEIDRIVRIFRWITLMLLIRCAGPEAILGGDVQVCRCWAVFACGGHAKR